MKNKLLVCLVACTMFLSPSLCRADYQDNLKENIRRSFVENCLEGYNSASDGDAPLALGLKYCRCIADRIMDEYSLEEIIAFDNYDEKTQEMTEKIESFADECIIKVISKSKK